MAMMIVVMMSIMYGEDDDGEANIVDFVLMSIGRISCRFYST